MYWRWMICSSVEHTIMLPIPIAHYYYNKTDNARTYNVIRLLVHLYFYSFNLYVFIVLTVMRVVLRLQVWWCFHDIAL